MANIIIGLKAVDKGAGNVIQAIRKQIKGLTKQMAHVNQTTFKQTLDGFWKQRQAGVQANKDIQQGIVDRLKTQQRAKQQTTQAFETMRSEALKFGLSILFAGMALKRLATGAIRAIFNTYQKASGETSKLQRMTGELQAKWAFFKFSLIDALTQSPLFQKMIDHASNLLDKFNALGPDTKAGIVIALGAMAVLGGAMVAVGQILTVFSGTAGALKTVWKGIKKVWLSVAKISWTDAINSMKKMANTLSTEIIASMKWIAANPIKGLMAAGVITGIIMLVGWIFRLKDAMGGWGEFAKSVIRGTLRLFGTLWSFIKTIGQGIKSIFTGELFKFGRSFRRNLSSAFQTTDKLVGDPKRGFVSGRSAGDVWAGRLHDNGSGGQAPQTVNQTVEVNVDNFTANDQQAIRDLSDQVARDLETKWGKQMPSTSR